MAGNNSDYPRRRPDFEYNPKQQPKQTVPKRYTSFSSDINIPDSRYRASYDYQITSSVPKEASRNGHSTKDTKQPFKINKAQVFIVLTVAALAFWVALGSTRITLLNNKITEQKRELEKIQAINQTIQVDIEQSTDLTEIEHYATNVLGMNRPESHQTVYINPRQPDMVETDNSKGFIAFLRKLWSYIG